MYSKHYLIFINRDNIEPSYQIPYLALDLLGGAIFFLFQTYCIRGTFRLHTFCSGMESVELPSYALQVPRNFRCLLIGASESGKSFFISQLIKNKTSIFPGKYGKFLFCSPNIGESTYMAPRDISYKKSLEEWASPAQIVFFNHIISKEELLEHADSANGEKILLIIDDFSVQIFTDDLVYDLFTRLSSHRSIDSCISLHQGANTAKTRGKWYPLILNNSNFLVLFRSIYRAGTAQISSSVFPKGENFLQKCLDQATQVCGQHAYICVDANLKNPLNNRYGVRTNIFRENNLPMLLFKNPQNYLKKN